MKKTTLELREEELNRLSADTKIRIAKANKELAAYAMSDSSANRKIHRVRLEHHREYLEAATQRVKEIMAENKREREIEVRNKKIVTWASIAIISIVVGTLIVRVASKNK